jgi:hypothetical protein
MSLADGIVKGTYVALGMLVVEFVSSGGSDTSASNDHEWRAVTLIDARPPARLGAHRVIGQGGPMGLPQPFVCQSEYDGRPENPQRLQAAGIIIAVLQNELL